jgi:hypothetical protein
VQFQDVAIVVTVERRTGDSFAPFPHAVRYAATKHVDENAGTLRRTLQPAPRRSPSGRSSRSAARSRARPVSPLTITGRRVVPPTLTMRVSGEIGIPHPAPNMPNELTPTGGPHLAATEGRRPIARNPELTKRCRRTDGNAAAPPMPNRWAVADLPESSGDLTGDCRRSGQPNPRRVGSGSDSSVS